MDQVPQTAAKAQAGGITTSIVVVIAAIVARLTGWIEAPATSTLQDAILLLITAGVGYAVGFVATWLAPRNKDKIAAVLFLGTALTMLGGCETLGYNARIAAFEKGVIEPEVDAALEQTVQRLCALPADVMMRQVQRYGANVLQAAQLLCPEWQTLAAYMAASRGPATDPNGPLPTTLITGSGWRILGP